VEKSREGKEGLVVRLIPLTAAPGVPRENQMVEIDAITDDGREVSLGTFARLCPFGQVMDHIQKNLADPDRGLKRPL